MSTRELRQRFNALFTLVYGLGLTVMGQVTHGVVSVIACAVGVAMTFWAIYLDLSAERPV